MADVGGMLGGAAGGALAGSAGGPIGMAVGGALGLVGSLFGGKSAKKAAKRQKRLAQAVAKEAQLQSAAALRQFDIETEMQRVAQVRANVQTQQERVQQVREARIRRAQIQQSAVGAGVGAATVAGAVGGISSTLGRNLGLINVAQGFAERLSQLGIQVAGEQRTQMEHQGIINILQGQGQVQQAKAQQGLATGQLISDVGGSIFNIGMQLGGTSSLFNPSGKTGVPTSLSNINVPGVR